MRRSTLSLIAVLLFADFVPAADPTQDQSLTIISTLFGKEWKANPNWSINDLSMIDLLNNLSKDCGIDFVVNMDSFRSNGFPDFLEKRPNVASTGFRGQNLHQAITTILNTVNAGYLIKDGHLELVPLGSAEYGNGSTLPLINTIVSEDKLSSRVELLAKRYDLSVAFTSSAAESAAKPVSARILNLPADRALTLLAAQCDLRVVRIGTAYLIATPTQASTLDTEQVKIEKTPSQGNKLPEAEVSKQRLKQDGTSRPVSTANLKPTTAMLRPTSVT